MPNVIPDGIRRPIVRFCVIPKLLYQLFECNNWIDACKKLQAVMVAALQDETETLKQSNYKNML